MTTTDTTSDVMFVHDAVNNLDVEAIVALPIETALVVWQILEEANRVLAQVRSVVMPRVAEQMTDRQMTVEGAGTFVRHVKKDRTQWDRDALVSAVLDSRLVDETTGEVTEESPLDKVRHCWNLGAPRTTALKARGIDADQFCRTERGGYTIEVL